MKLIKKLGMSTAMAFGAMMLLAGCGESAAPAAETKAAPAQEVVKPVISDTQLSYRNQSLEDESTVVPPKVEYTDAAPGTSKRFKRAYQDAPPMIPHSVDGLLPITKDNNQCLGCHMPDVAPSMGATPIPPSHFTNFRPKTEVKGGIIFKNGKPVKNTSDEKLGNVSIKKQKHLYQGRFNCSQCHAPQAKLNPLVENKFTADYKKKDGAFKSSWTDEEYMKDIDTTK
jgi:cytochrome c-type protein NapB